MRKKRKNTRWIENIDFSNGEENKIKNNISFIRNIKTTKTSLKSIVRNDDIIDKLKPIVIMTNKIVTNTLMFMKLFFIHCYDTNIQFPIIDRLFVTACMQIICKNKLSCKRKRKTILSVENEVIISIDNEINSSTEHNKNIKKKNISKDFLPIRNILKVFFKDHYEKLMVENLNNAYISSILNYAADSIVTMYENNIKQQFIKHVCRFVNVMWHKKELIEEYNEIFESTESTDAQKYFENTVNACFKKIKNDILNVSDDVLTSDIIYHENIRHYKQFILPKKSFMKDSVYYDIACKPQDYLHSMIYMMKQIEARGQTMSNVFPLRREIAPKYISIDTLTLINILVPVDQRTFYKTNGNVSLHKDILWSRYFKTNQKCFKNFKHMIMTDGVGCSILSETQMVKKPMMSKTNKSGFEEKYIDELKKNEYAKLKDKKIVGIDPNMRDLLYCSSINASDDGTIDTTLNTMRYTQMQRRKETKLKKYQKILQTKKDETKYQGKTITMLDTEMSKNNGKTLNFDKFKEYIKNKNELNQKTGTFNEQYLFRKLKWGGYILRQKTELKMLKQFEKTFGNPKETIIGYGDHAEKGHMKHHAPVKGVGFRKTFRRYGYEVYLVDEYMTSQGCNKCGGKCTPFLKRKNPRPNKENVAIVHGLLKCSTCSSLWNRDMNASMNMYKITKSAILGLGRPTYLQRPQQSPP